MPAAAAARAAAASPFAPHFTKMHGAGNDFVVLDLRRDATLAARLDADAPALCRALADRHTGVGCDQILTVEAPRSAAALASYRIWNADGSPSQQCGNGARCVAAWVERALLAEGDPRAGTKRFLLDSPAGSHLVDALGDLRYAVAMGVPQFAPHAVPLRGFASAQDEYAIEAVLRDGARIETLRFGAVSMGNPHAVLEVADVHRAPVASVGPALQHSAAFPESVNVGFAEVVSRERIRLRVYERGSGETLACGSGACAAAAVLMRRGRIDRSVRVSLLGGDLRVDWPDDAAPITMAGPAAFVYEGVVDAGLVEQAQRHAGERIA